MLKCVEKQVVLSLIKHLNAQFKATKNYDIPWIDRYLGNITFKLMKVDTYERSHLFLKMVPRLLLDGVGQQKLEILFNVAKQYNKLDKLRSALKIGKKCKMDTVEQFCRIIKSNSDEFVKKQIEKKSNNADLLCLAEHHHG